MSSRSPWKPPKQPTGSTAFDLEGIAGPQLEIKRSRNAQTPAVHVPSRPRSSLVGSQKDEGDFGVLILISGSICPDDLPPRLKHSEFY